MILEHWGIDTVFCNPASIPVSVFPEFLHSHRETMDFPFLPQYPLFPFLLDFEYRWFRRNCLQMDEPSILRATCNSKYPLLKLIIACPLPNLPAKRYKTIPLWRSNGGFQSISAVNPRMLVFSDFIIQAKWLI